MFSTGALLFACLDYAGEELELCDPDAGAKGACADAAAPVPTGGGSGSGS